MSIGKFDRATHRHPTICHGIAGGGGGNGAWSWVHSSSTECPIKVLVDTSSGCDLPGANDQGPHDPSLSHYGFAISFARRERGMNSVTKQGNRMWFSCNEICHFLLDRNSGSDIPVKFGD